MEMSNQQKETLAYFKAFAEDWDRKAKIDSDRVNVIKQRNDYIISKARSVVCKNFLDVGCGTGDLIIELEQQGIDCVGVDFSSPMIQIARDSSKSGLKSKVEFLCANIFECDFGERKFNIISANGFIEYISLNELHKFIQFAFDNLTEGGMLIVGSRNRLFNLFSHNHYTKAELDNGNYMRLLDELHAIRNARFPEDIQHFEPASLQCEHATHPNTGIDVNSRFQYTPCQLMALLKNHNLSVHEIYPIHIHGVQPSFAAKFPIVHKRISDLLQQCVSETLDLIGQASSFMITATKGGRVSAEKSRTK